jgi:hypothetical protein
MRNRKPLHSVARMTAIKITPRIQVEPGARMRRDPVETVTISFTCLDSEASRRLVEWLAEALGAGI